MAAQAGIAMELIIKVVLVVIAVVLVVAWVRRQWDKLLERLRAHRKVIIGVAVAAVTITVAWFAALPRLGGPDLPNALPPGPGSTPVELEPTVDSSWSATGNGVRASSGIALTTAAAMGKAEGVVWQNWMVPTGTKELTQRLQPNRSYQFNLALTPGEVKLAGAQVTIASAQAQQAVRETLLTQRQVVLKAVFLADPERLSLQPGESAEKELVIDVPRLFADREHSMGEGESESLDSIVERAFGRVTYAVQTGATGGWTKAGVLLLANNRGIDQIVTTQCIGECEGSMPAGRISGAPRLLAMLQDAPAADISLFLTEFEPGRLHGVLVSGEPVNGSTSWTWDTTRGAAGFANLLRQTIAQMYNEFDARDELLSKGSALSDLVFGDTAAPNEALEVFRQLVIRSSQWQNGDGLAPKSLFVHFDFADADEGPMIVPIGLMTFTDAAGKPDFVGHHLMIEQPMLVPRYGVPAQCTSKWVALMPDAAAAQDALNLARSAVLRLGTTWPGTDRFQEFNDIDAFKGWLRAGASAEPTIVTTLSHHAANLMYFRQGGPSIASPNVQRSFGPASIAVLNGCGTGKSGAMDFVVRFNRHGVDSAIVSSFNVNGAIAGTYLACLRQALSRGTTSIAGAHFRAVNDCNWSDEQSPAATAARPPPKLTQATYAANALKYVLVGNSATTVCQ